MQGLNLNYQTKVRFLRDYSKVRLFKGLGFGGGSEVRARDYFGLIAGLGGLRAVGLRMWVWDRSSGGVGLGLMGSGSSGPVPKPLNPKPLNPKPLYKP